VRIVLILHSRRCRRTTTTALACVSLWRGRREFTLGRPLPGEGRDNGLAGSVVQYGGAADPSVAKVGEGPRRLRHRVADSRRADAQPPASCRNVRRPASVASRCAAGAVAVRRRSSATDVDSQMPARRRAAAIQGP
jgi:hypothetical protein